MARKKKEREPKTDQSFDFRDKEQSQQEGLSWWQEDLPEGEERGRLMVDTARILETGPGEMLRQDLNILYASLFEGVGLRNLFAYGGRATLDAIARGHGINTAETTWNQIRAVILTVASQVSRTKPRARFVTTNGNWRQRQRAKRLTQLNDGLFALEKVYEKTQKAFVLAGAMDVVGVEVIRGETRPELELVFGTELFVDTNDGLYGNPRRLYRRKFVDRRVILKRLGKTPEQREAILSARAEDPTHMGGNPTMIQVYEAWSLPTKRGGSDGYHVIAVDGEGGTLLEEGWKRPYFPIRLFCWDPALSGPYGRCAAEVLLPNQIAINTLLDKISRAQHLACVPRVGIQRGSKILKSELTNGIGTVIQFGSSPPIWWTPNALSPEVYQQLERHWTRGFESYGVSPQIASGQKAAGTTSGEAIRESLDVQTARFAVLAQRWENLHLDIAMMFIDVCRDLYEDDPEKVIAAPGTSLLQSIRWKDVDLEEDAFVIQPYPTSLLPQTPQGRIDRVSDLVARGIWDPKRAAAALDDLDVEANMSAERSAEKEAEKICEDILEDGIYTTPDAAMDLDAMLRIGSQYRAVAELDDGELPEKHVDLIYKFLDDVAALKLAINPPPPPAPPGGPQIGNGPGPGGPPAAGPPAPMLTNAP